MQKYTAIWQSPNPHEREWIEEILGHYISEYVTDGKHELVLDNVILLDAFVYCHDPAYYAQFRGRNAFLVHFLDENYEGRYEIYNNFRGVLRCFWSNTFDPGHVMKMPLGYCNGMARGNRFIERATKRKYIWSFVGQVSKSSRPEMARALASAEPHFLYSTDDVKGFAILNQLDGKPKRFAPPEFSSFLFESTFSPCPMGNANLECFRVYEALECGSIPILEKRWTLDYFKELLGDHPLPTVRSWPEARRMIGRMLENPAQIDGLQERCISWWETYKLEYSAQVGEFLRIHSANAALRTASIASSAQKLPGWQMMELARHHDAAAFSRRIRKQIARFYRQGKLRVAHRPGTRPD